MLGWLSAQIYYGCRKNLSIPRINNGKFFQSNFSFVPTFVRFLQFLVIFFLRDFSHKHLKGNFLAHIFAKGTGIVTGVRLFAVSVWSLFVGGKLNLPGFYCVLTFGCSKGGKLTYMHLMAFELFSWRSWRFETNIKKRNIPHTHPLLYTKYSTSYTAHTLSQRPCQTAIECSIKRRIFYVPYFYIKTVNSLYSWKFD